MGRKLIDKMKGAAVKFTALLMAGIFLSVCCINVYADDDTQDSGSAGELVIESVQAVMPEIRAYLRGNRQISTSDITAVLDTSELTVSNVELFEQTGQGITYYVLLDVSASFSAAYFSALQNSLVTFYGGLPAQDRLVLITFGSSVQTVLTGDETPEQAQEAIMSLTNGDSDTFFYEALLQAAEETDRNDVNSREVIMMISDGGDDHNRGKANEQEAISALNKRSIPVYGYAAGANETNLDSFKFVTDACGGTVTEFTAQETDKIFTNFARMLGEMQIVTMLAGSNIPSNKTQNLQLTLLFDGSTVSGDVLVTEHIPDETAPTIIAVRQSSDKELIVNFSEQVSGADKATAYVVTCDGTQLDVMSAEYDTADYSAVIGFNSELRPGEYVIEVRNVNDVSAEANPVTESFKKVITDESGNSGETTVQESEVVTDESQEQTEDEESGNSYVIYIIIGCVVLAAVGVFVVLSISRRKKQQEEERREREAGQKRREQPTQSETGYAGQPTQSKIVKPQLVSGRKIIFEVLNVEAGNNSRIETELNKSLIVGRADICDVSIKDGKMSRQHFSLEEKNGAIFIRDLQTTNGTGVNGVKLSGARKLNSGDVISAGSMKIRVRW